MPATNAESATLAWDSSTSTDVVSYKVYYFRPGGPTNSVNVGNVTTARITSLTFPTSFYATAVNADGLESLPSNLLKDVHWETDVTVKAQSSPTLTGTFTNAFTVLTKTNVSGTEFYRLSAEASRRLAPSL